LLDECFRAERIAESGRKDECPHAQRLDHLAPEQLGGATGTHVCSRSLLEGRISSCVGKLPEENLGNHPVVLLLEGDAEDDHALVLVTFLDVDALILSERNPDCLCRGCTFPDEVEVVEHGRSQDVLLDALESVKILDRSGREV